MSGTVFDDNILIAISYYKIQIVYNYQHPSCMASPIFWWSYSGKYEEKDGPSIINPHEAKMVAGLCLWLLSQRTEDEQTQRIQVLTPYRAQVCSQCV